jgi:hypothetical protein
MLQPVFFSIDCVNRREVDEIRRKNMLFEELSQQTFEGASGCAASTPANSIDLSSCDACFRDAADRFQAVDCNGADANSPVYTPEAGCPAEEALLSDEAPLTACELRAYLFATHGFSLEYTGYGYTANTVRSFFAFFKLISQAYF